VSTFIEPRTRSTVTVTVKAAEFAGPFLEPPLAGFEEDVFHLRR
jgi:hypothetical protein